jgi:hypothetical protein
MKGNLFWRDTKGDCLRDEVGAGAGWDGIGGRGTIVPMALNYTQQKALAMQWKAAGPALRKARHADIRRQDNAAVLRSLDELSRHVLKTAKPRKSSGLVEMYKILGRSRNR